MKNWIRVSGLVGVAGAVGVAALALPRRALGTSTTTTTFHCPGSMIVQNVPVDSSGFSTSLAIVGTNINSTFAMNGTMATLACGYNLTQASYPPAFQCGTWAVGGALNMGTCQEYIAVTVGSKSSTWDTRSSGPCTPTADKLGVTCTKTNLTVPTATAKAP
jgi:hypothetical protein